jgi:hypothetical protein
MASVPSEVLQKLPLAPIFDQLPEDWKQKVRGIYANVSIPWSDKHQKIGELMASMPPEIRSLLPQHPPFVAPPRPPNNGFPMAVCFFSGIFIVIFELNSSLRPVSRK